MMVREAGGEGGAMEVAQLATTETKCWALQFISWRAWVEENGDAAAAAVGAAAAAAAAARSTRERGIDCCGGRGRFLLLVGAAGREEGEEEEGGGDINMLLLPILLSDCYKSVGGCTLLASPSLSPPHHAAVLGCLQGACGVFVWISGG